MSVRFETRIRVKNRVKIVFRVRLRYRLYSGQELVDIFPYSIFHLLLYWGKSRNLVPMLRNPEYTLWVGIVGALVAELHFNNNYVIDVR